MGDTTTLTSVTDDKSNTYNVADNTGSNGFRNATFYLLNVTNGPTTITGNIGGGGALFLAIAADEYSSVPGSTSFDVHTMQAQTSVATGANTVTSGNTTTTANAELIYGCAVSAGNHAGSVSPGTGFTARQTSEGAGNDFLYTEDETQSVAGSVAATFGISASDNYITGILTFIAPSSGGGLLLRGVGP